MSNKLVAGGRGIDKKSMFHRILKFAYHKIFKYHIPGWSKLFNRENYDIIHKPFLTFDVPVDLIVYKVESPLRPPLHRTFLNYKIRTAGLIDNADWDLHLVKFSAENIYSGLKERFVEGKEWEATIYYQLFKKYKGLEEVLSCQTWEEYKEKRLRFFDRLYNDIKINGYKKQANPEDEVSVAISRDGQILFVDGHHRLAMAKVLKIGAIPVFVNIWHKQYIEKLKFINNCKRITALHAFESLGIEKGYTSLLST